MKTFFATLITLILLTAGSLQAQDFSQAIGLRGGLDNGITYKTSIDGTNAFDLILHSRWSGFSFTALYERHFYPFEVDGLYAYYGAGGHVGFYDNRSPWFEGANSGVVLGADAVIGMEYVFEDFPINLSFDWKPVFNLVGHRGFYGGGFGLSARYIIK
jgi:hypothetical protein